MMMKKKLTLTIDKSVSEKAKRLAKREGTSVSRWVEQLLIEKTGSASGWQPQPGSWTQKMLGAGDLPDQRNYKEIKQEEILKKYGG